MGPTGRLSDLLERYFELRARGEPVALEDLCRDCPDLLADLRREVAAAESVGSTVRNPWRSAGPGDAAIESTDFVVPESVPGYELLEELGRGGMGVVYKARQVSLNRAVAVKLVRAGGFPDSEGRDRFLAEAAVIARLRHPNVVQVFECSAQGAPVHFSMELCEGGSLARRLRDGPLPPREAAALLRSAAEGVQAAHDQGVIHRDLSPANILLAGGSGPAAGDRPLAEFVPKISDFGLAKQADVDLTHSRLALGTPRYMSPEQTFDSRSVDARSDVYALGAILYECLTGRPPFEAASALDVLDQVRHQPPAPVRQFAPGVPRDLETICLKCLEKERARRYATARELPDDLGRFLAGDPVRARAAGPLARLARWARRPQRVPFAGRLAVALYTALAVWKALALALVALEFGIYPRDVGQCLAQGVAVIGLLNLPQIGVGLATLRRWPPGPWVGAGLSLVHLAVLTGTLSTGVLTFGGLLEEPNTRALVWCLLVIPGCLTLGAYALAIVALRAGRHEQG